MLLTDRVVEFYRGYPEFHVPCLISCITDADHFGGKILKMDNFLSRGGVIMGKAKAKGETLHAGTVLYGTQASGAASRRRASEAILA